MTLEQNIRSIIETCFTESKEEIQISAVKSIMKLLGGYDPDKPLKWVERDYSSHNRLYLAYRSGYPLTVVDWECGEGYRDIRNYAHVNPELLARINLPK